MVRQFERNFAEFYRQSGAVIMTFFGGLSDFRLSKNENHRLMVQMLRVGWETVPLALLIGLFTGMTVALGTGIVLAQFNQQEFIARIVSESIIKEMGPVFTAFIIAARVGAAMTAELGTMAVNEEVNVLRVLGIRVNRYLVSPRIIAAVTMTPALTAYSIMLGLLGGAAVSVAYFDVSFTVYKNEAFRFIDMGEVLGGLFKSVVFGAIYSSVCCFKGLETTGGAKGVGNATTSAVVISLSGILIANYLLTRFLFG